MEKNSNNNNNNNNNKNNNNNNRIDLLTLFTYPHFQWRCGHRQLRWSGGRQHLDHMWHRQDQRYHSLMAATLWLLFVAGGVLPSQKCHC